MKKILFIFLMILLGSSLLFAAELVYAEGEGFTLVRDGEKIYYDFNMDDVLGLQFREGDTILTENHTFVEIDFGPTEALIKVAEDTTVTLKSFRSQGDAVVGIAHGRMRVRLGTLPPGTLFWVTGYDTVAGLRGEDFGIDLFHDRIREDSERFTSVYCFEGEVQVLQPGVPGTEEINKIELSQMSPTTVPGQKMVSTVSSAPAEKFKTRDIEPEIWEYWGLYPFMAAVNWSDAVLPVIEEEVLEVTPVLTLEQRKKRRSNAGKVLFGTGVGLATAGALVMLLGEQNATLTTVLGLSLIGAGGASLITGTGFLISAASLK